jgi:hypothetical protein
MKAMHMRRRQLKTTSMQDRFTSFTQGSAGPAAHAPDRSLLDSPTRLLKLMSQLTSLREKVARAELAAQSKSLSMKRQGTPSKSGLRSSSH